MQFSVSGTFWRDMQLTDSSGYTIASLSYPRWFSQQAEVTLADGSIITLGKKGFWRMDMQAAIGDDVIYDVHIKWIRRITITGRGRTYGLEKTNFWRQEYALVTDDGQQAVAINSSFSFIKPRYRFEIETDDSDPVANDPVLLFTLVFCLNYLRATSAAAAT